MRKRIYEGEAVQGISVSIEPSVMKHITDLVGNRNRSKFIRDAITEKLDRDVKKVVEPCQTTK